MSEKLKEINATYLEKSKQYDKLYDEYQRMASDIHIKRQAVEAFNATLSLYKDQIELHKKNLDKVFPHEKFALQSNFGILQKRLEHFQVNSQ